VILLAAADIELHEVIGMKLLSTGVMLGLLAAVGFLVSGGCVQPGDFDPSIIAKYQRKMAQYAPSKRLGGRQELGLLDPAPREGLAPLKVEEVKDKSGKVVDRIIRLKVEDAIVRALANSPAVQVVSFDPAISREEMVQAAAAFDVVVFGAASHEKTDNKRYASLLAPRTDERNIEAGLRQLLPTGTQWELTWAASREWDDLGNAASPTSFEPTVNLQITQPLLRGGWLDFNMARLRITRLAHKSSMEAFRLEVENTVTQVYQLYWRLHQAVRDVEIHKDLLTKTRETYRLIRERRGIDAPENVQVKQAESAVESRDSALVLAEKIVRDVQDQLGVLLGDPQINALGKYRIVPTTPFAEGPATFNVRDQLAAALKHNPTLAQGRLAIQAAGIQVKVAKNEMLPRLDLIASSGFQGMAGSKAVAGKELTSTDYTSYTVGLEFEYPIGNRQRKSQLRVRKLERDRAVASFQQAADQIAATVRERIRQLDTAWNAVRLQRSAIAAGKTYVQGLTDQARLKEEGKTPVFTWILLESQQRLAEDERAAVQLLVDYNSAIYELRRVTGTILDLPGIRLDIP